jgi:hypothetical protein
MAPRPKTGDDGIKKNHTIRAGAAPNARQDRARSARGRTFRIDRRSWLSSSFPPNSLQRMLIDVIGYEFRSSPSASTRSARQPMRQVFPISRATTAAWAVLPLNEDDRVAFELERANMVEINFGGSFRRVAGIDQTFLHEVHGDPHSGERSAFGGARLGARLQEIEFAFFDGEVDVLDVAELLFQLLRVLRSATSPGVRKRRLHPVRRKENRNRAPWRWCANMLEVVCRSRFRRFGVSCRAVG